MNEGLELPRWSLRKYNEWEVMTTTCRKTTPLEVSVEVDEFTKAASTAFDFEFTGTTKFYPFIPPTLPEQFTIGLIVGPSGSGKSTMLRDIGTEFIPAWNPQKAIISQFSTPDLGIEYLSGVGLNSIPSWMRPYHVLSTGERFRADLARKMDTNKNLIVVDEFTSTVDRNVAKAASCALRRLAEKFSKRVVLASCHYDIVDWLQPDWLFDTLNGEFYVGRLLRQRPPIKLEIQPCSRQIWSIFKDHHYLSGSLSSTARCFIATWNENLVAFASSLPMPNGYIKKGWRGHRMVVLPDFQGLGIGPRLSNTIAQLHIEEGKRYFSRTAHPRLGAYRDNSPLWKPTSKHKALRVDVGRNIKAGKERYNHYYADYSRICFSHEYIGKH